MRIRSKKQGLIPLIVSFILLLFAANAFAAECSDTDDKSFYTFGTVSFNGSTYQDTCADLHTVVEQRCYQGAHTEARFYCPYQCSGGKCIEEPVFIPQECVDGDGGIDLETASYVINNDGVRYDDTCYGQNIIDEKICHNNLVQTKYRRCDFGCSEGRCLPEPNKECIDPDDGDIFIQSVSRDENGKDKEEYCETPNRVAEYVCEEGTLVKKEILCPGICRNGACRKALRSNQHCDEDEVLCFRSYISACKDNQRVYEQCEFGCDGNGCLSDPARTSKPKPVVQESLSEPKKPEPQPVAQPQPVAEPTVETQPEPQPEPAAQPVAQPQPAQQPVPAAQPQPVAQPQPEQSTQQTSYGTPYQPSPLKRFFMWVHGMLSN